MTIPWKSLPAKARLLMGRVAIPAIFAVAFLVVLASSSRTVNVYDDGVILTGATRVMAGAVIHRDFYANYGPAQFWVLAFLFERLGTSVLVATFWGALVKASIVSTVFLLGRRIMPGTRSAVCSAVALLWLSCCDLLLWPAWPALLASMVSAVQLFQVFRRTRAAISLAAAGVAVGVATLFRYDIGGIVCLAEAAVLLAYRLVETRGIGRGDRVRSIAATFGAYLAGVAVVCVPFAVALLWEGALNDFIFDVVLFPAHHYAATRSLPFPWPVEGRRPPWEGEYVVYLPVLIFCCVLLAAIPRKNSQPARFLTASVDSRRGGWELALLTALMLGFFAKGLVRVGSLHMSLAVVPAMLIMAALLSANSRRKVWTVFSTALACATAVAIVLTCDAFESVRDRIASNLRSDRTGYCEPKPGLEREACFKTSAQQAAAVRFVQAATTPLEPIFVGLPQHRRIFVNNVAFYFAANRRPATKWYHFDPGLQNTAPIQQLMIGDLIRAHPRFVILDSDWEDHREPNASAQDSGARLLDDFIAANYRRVAAFGALTILEAASDSESAAPLEVQAPIDAPGKQPQGEAHGAPIAR
jgi:hypothetical protein